MADANNNLQSSGGEHPDDSANKRSSIVYVLWTIQVLLALLFLFSGVAKLVMSAEAMKGPVPIPVLFLRFIGVCELLGAFGLILPGLLGIRKELTSLAATGLVIIMIGATVVNLAGGLFITALITVVAGLLAAFVAYRGRLPRRASAQSGSATTRPTVSNQV